MCASRCKVVKQVGVAGDLCCNAQALSDGKRLHQSNFRARWVGLTSITAVHSAFKIGCFALWLGSEPGKTSPHVRMPAGLFMSSMMCCSGLLLLTTTCNLQAVLRWQHDHSLVAQNEKSSPPMRCHTPFASSSPESTRKMSRSLRQSNILMSSSAPSPGLQGAAVGPHAPAATTIIIREHKQPSG